MMMKTNKNYRPPMILQEVSVQLERDLLKSLVDELLIESTGQQVENYDFSTDVEDNPFTVSWE